MWEEICWTNWESFHTRCNEQLQYFKYWKLNSAFAKHLHDSVKFSWAAVSRCEGFPTFRVLTSLKKWTELVPGTSENFHILMQLSAQENFVEFCRCESFKTYITYLILDTHLALWKFMNCSENFIFILKQKEITKSPKNPYYEPVKSTL